MTQPRDGRVDIRWAARHDAPDVATVHVAAWREAYAGLLDQVVLDALEVGERTVGWSAWVDRSLAGLPTDDGAIAVHRMLVAETEGRVVGWATFGAGRDPDAGDRGELAGLYVHPAKWGGGVGETLLRRVELELRAEGRADAYLWVLHGNDRARRFYERRGWRADGAEKTGQAGGADQLREHRHVRRIH